MDIGRPDVVGQFIAKLKQSAAPRTPIDVVNATCKEIEDLAGAAPSKVAGSDKLDAAVTLLELAWPILLKQKVVSQDLYEEVDKLLLSRRDLQNTINSVIAIWNQFKTTGCFQWLKSKCKCCCC